MITLYRTEVLDLPPSPLGLLPRRFRVIHTCNTCHAQVPTHELIAHTQNHTQPIDEPNP